MGSINPENTYMLYFNIWIVRIMYMQIVYIYWRH